MNWIIWTKDKFIRFMERRKRGDTRKSKIVCPYFDEKNHQVLWKQEPVDPAQSYTLTLVDHYLFIPFFPTIEIAGTVEFLFPDFIRTVVGDYLSQKYPIQ